MQGVCNLCGWLRKIVLFLYYYIWVQCFMLFNIFGLSEKVFVVVDVVGYKDFIVIQVGVIFQVLEWWDVFGIVQIGIGKMVSFILLMLMFLEKGCV